MKHIKFMYAAAIAVTLACSMCSVVAQEMSAIKQVVLENLCHQVRAQDLDPFEYGSDWIKKLSTDLINAYDKLITNQSLRKAIEDLPIDRRRSDVYLGSYFILKEKKERAKISAKTTTGTDRPIGMSDILKPGFVENITDSTIFVAALDKFTRSLNAAMLRCYEMNCTNKDELLFKEDNISDAVEGFFENAYIFMPNQSVKSHIIALRERLGTLQEQAYQSYLQSKQTGTATSTISKAPAILRILTIEFVQGIKDQTTFDAALKQFTNSLKADMFKCTDSLPECTSSNDFVLENNELPGIRYAFESNKLFSSLDQKKLDALYTILKQKAYENYLQSKKPGTATTVKTGPSTATGADLWTPEAVATRIEGIKKIITQDEWIKAYEQFIESLASYPTPNNVFFKGVDGKGEIVKDFDNPVYALEMVLWIKNGRLSVAEWITSEQTQKLKNKKSEEILKILNK